jgi:hypothetical protein
MPRAPSDAQFSPPAHFAHTLLPARDPAALVFMERVSLFGLGVNANTLALIFTGAGNRAARRNLKTPKAIILRDPEFPHR